MLSKILFRRAQALVRHPLAQFGVSVFKPSINILSRTPESPSMIKLPLPLPKDLVLPKSVMSL